MTCRCLLFNVAACTRVCVCVGSALPVDAPQPTPCAVGRARAGATRKHGQKAVESAEGHEPGQCPWDLLSLSLVQHTSARPDVILIVDLHHCDEQARRSSLLTASKDQEESEVSLPAAHMPHMPHMPAHERRHVGVQAEPARSTWCSSSYAHAVDGSLGVLGTCVRLHRCAVVPLMPLRVVHPTHARFPNANNYVILIQCVCRTTRKKPTRIRASF